MLSQNTAKSLLSFRQVSERLITARLQGKHCKITVVQCYAPTNDASEEEKDRFYSSLRGVVEEVPTHDVLVVMGDFNAKIGRENTGLERVIGKHGCGEMNENGERLIDFSLECSLVVGGSLFQHKDIHKLTWKSPDGKTINQIDNLLINSRWRSSLLDVRVFRGADLYTDHFLLVGTLRLRLRNSYDKKICRKRYDVDRLKNSNVKKEYREKLRSCFGTLACAVQPGDIENRWDAIREGFCKTAEVTLKYRRANKKEWITEETWASVEERGRIKAKLLDAKSERIRERIQKEYDAKIERSKRVREESLRRTTSKRSRGSF